MNLAALAFVLLDATGLVFCAIELVVTDCPITANYSDGYGAGYGNISQLGIAVIDDDVEEMYSTILDGCDPTYNGTEIIEQGVPISGLTALHIACMEGSIGEFFSWSNVLLTPPPFRDCRTSPDLERC